MAMSNAERQAAYRARQKQKAEALRNGVNDESLRDEVWHLKINLKAAKGQLLGVPALHNEIKKLKATIDTLKAFKAEEVDKWLPDELKKEKTKLKAARTRLQNDRMSFDTRVSVSNKLDKPDIRRIQRCLHPDRQPEENRGKFDAALALFNRAVT